MWSLRLCKQDWNERILAHFVQHSSHNLQMVIYGIRRMFQMFSKSAAWWRHQMETFSALLAICAGNSPVTGEFPTKRPVTRSFDVFFDLRLNERLSKQSWSWWFETPSWPLWRHIMCVKSVKMCWVYIFRFRCLQTMPGWHTCWGPFRWYGLTLIPIWISNNVHYNVWGEFNYPFPNSIGKTGNE